MTVAARPGPGTAPPVAGAAPRARHLPLGVSGSAAVARSCGTVRIVNDGDGPGEDYVHAGEPTSHRRPGPAAIRMPAEPVTFRGVLADNFREVLFIAASVLAALVWGGSSVATGDSPAARAAGAATIVAGLLLLASYALRFRRPVLEDDRWFRSRPRRVVRLVLVYAWGVYFATVLVVGLGVQVWRWWR